MNTHSKLPIVFLYTDQSSSIEGATRFQKLVFLAQEERNLKDIYSFRPDRFGPYSTQLRSDLEILDEEGFIDRDIDTNYFGYPRIIYSLTPKGVREAKKLLNTGNEGVFDIVQDIKGEMNDRPISYLLQYVYNHYEDYVKATELDTTSLFDPDAISEFEQAPTRETASPSTVGDLLKPTPHTLYQLPKRETNAYFYYFTDHAYNAEDSKFRELDDQLTLFGRNRSKAEVAIIDRDSIRSEIWDSLIEGFGVDDYPALIVAEKEIGVRDVDLSTADFSPSDADYATIENGVIADNILQDSDKVRDFLNGLFDCARKGDLKEGMRKRKVIEALSIGKDEITDLLTLSP